MEKRPNFFPLAVKYAGVALVILMYFSLASCSKEQSSNDPVSPMEKQEKEPRTFVYNRNDGMLTIKYADGKKVIRDIPTDSISARKISTFRAVEEVIVDGDDFPDPDVPLSDQNYVPRQVIEVECTVVRAEAGGLITSVRNYIAYPIDPVVYYEKKHPNWPDGPPIRVKRQAQVMNVTGSAAPLPGLPVTVTWRYTINYVYTYWGAMSGVNTRQYNASTVRVYW